MSTTIAKQINRKVIWRILFAYFLTFLVLIYLSLYDINMQISSLKSKYTNMADDISEYIGNQYALGNSKGIRSNIHEIAVNNGLNIKWSQSRKSQYKDNIVWHFPFSWIYSHPVVGFGGKKYGVLYLSGSILNNAKFLSQFIVRFSLLLLSFVIIFLFLYPMFYKLPRKLFIKPIQDILNLIKSEEYTEVATEPLPEEAIEIRELKKNIADLLVKIKTNTKNAELAKLASQVAHDIRSPVAAIMMLSKQCIELPEMQRTALRTVAVRIQDIANALLTRYSYAQDKVINKMSAVLVSTAVFSLLSEKRVEYRNANIEFRCEPSNDSCFSFIDIDSVEFKRLLSNLINNAVEAIGTKAGKITILLYKRQTKLHVDILDTGKGMSYEEVHLLLSDNKVESMKPNGHGFGLQHAKQTLKQFSGTFDINSQLGVGTKIGLTFKTSLPPQWIINEIEINQDDCIIILDDDNSIHAAWERHLSHVITKSDLVQIKHFTQSDECINYIYAQKTLNSLLLLTDYELINQNVSGLDVIEKTGVMRAVLVTSHFESQDILERAILLKTKVLPKVLASNVNIIFNRH